MKGKRKRRLLISLDFMNQSEQNNGDDGERKNLDKDMYEPSQSWTSTLQNELDLNN